MFLQLSPGWLVFALFIELANTHQNLKQKAGCRFLY